MKLLRTRFSSIAARLLFASALLLPLFLGITGFFLDRAFENSLEVAEQARLRGHINLLFSVADIPEGDTAAKNSLRMPLSLFETDFEQPNSGLYAYIFNDQKELVWHSNSAALIQPPRYYDSAENNQPGKMVIYQKVFERKRYFVAHYDVLWEDANSKPHPFRFFVMHSASEYKSELSAYRRELWRWLGAAGVFLLLAQIIIMQWGLRPLSKLALALKAMQSGDTSSIEGEQPKELRRVVDNLNQVLAREQALRQRYRNSLSDLAHSLKTPLAVLQSKLGQAHTSADELQTIAQEQVARMSQVVTYQLQRAVSSQQGGTHHRTRLEPLAQRLLSALHKVYADKHISHECTIPADAMVAGDEQDVMELLGNIVENAFKYGSSRVHLAGVAQHNKLLITVEDDGPGVPIEERERILERGKRLDTNKPGQGIGLAVAAEIVRSYEGSISVDSSPLGGARFSILLPCPIE